MATYNPELPLTIFMGPNSFVKIILSATAGAFVGAASFVEDTVQLANNEVKSLERAQAIRLDEVADERETLQIERDTLKIEAGTHQWADDKLVRITK